MNIKELLAKRKGLIAKLKAADSKEALDELTAALDEIDAQIEVCREKAKILDGMESNEPTGGEGDGDDPDGEEGKKYRSLGAKAASEIKSVDAHSSFTVHVGAVKAAGDPAKRPEVVHASDHRGSPRCARRSTSPTHGGRPLRSRDH